MSDSMPPALHATPYPPQAFQFLQRGLSYAAKSIHGEAQADQTGQSRHISGAQLAQGLRDFAVEEYGLMARFVLERWRITRTRDFGEMVYALIEAEIMSKNDTDSINDFNAVYDFETAFPTEIAFSSLPAEYHGQD